MALDSDQVGGAFLDAFTEEPLPSENPYWRHPIEIVTPHMASELLPRTAVRSMAVAIRHRDGGNLFHVYDRTGILNHGAQHKTAAPDVAVVECDVKNRLQPPFRGAVKDGGKERITAQSGALNGGRHD